MNDRNSFMLCLNVIIIMFFPVGVTLKHFILRRSKLFNLDKVVLVCFIFLHIVILSQDSSYIFLLTLFFYKTLDYKVLYIK